MSQSICWLLQRGMTTHQGRKNSRTSWNVGNVTYKSSDGKTALWMAGFNSTPRASHGEFRSTLEKKCGRKLRSRRAVNSPAIERFSGLAIISRHPQPLPNRDRTSPGSNATYISKWVGGTGRSRQNEALARDRS